MLAIVDMHRGSRVRRPEAYPPCAPAELAARFNHGDIYPIPRKLYRCRKPGPAAADNHYVHERCRLELFTIIVRPRACAGAFSDPIFLWTWCARRSRVCVTEAERFFGSVRGI